MGFLSGLQRVLTDFFADFVCTLQSYSFFMFSGFSFDHRMRARQQSKHAIFRVRKQAKIIKQRINMQVFWMHFAILICALYCICFC